MSALEWYVYAGLAVFCGFAGGVLAAFLTNWSILVQFRGLYRTLQNSQGYEASKNKRQVSRGEMFKLLNGYAGAKAAGKDDLTALMQAASDNQEGAAAIAEKLGIKI